MKPKNTDKGQSIFIPSSAIKKGCIYKLLLGKMNGIEDLYEVSNDCRLCYNKALNRYTLCLIFHMIL